MGKSPDDIAGEIVDLRKESDIIVDELLRRATPGNVARGMTATVTDRATSVVAGVSERVNDAAEAVSHVTQEMPEPIRDHPMAVTYAAVGLTAGVVGFAASMISIARRPGAKDLAARRGRRTRRAADETLRGWQGRIRGLRRDARDVRLVVTREEPSMVKRVLWAGLASVMATLGSLLFKRMTASMWRTTMKEEPPKG